MGFLVGTLNVNTLREVQGRMQNIGSEQPRTDVEMNHWERCSRNGTKRLPPGSIQGIHTSTAFCWLLNINACVFTTWKETTPIPSHRKAHSISWLKSFQSHDALGFCFHLLLCLLSCHSMLLESISLCNCDTFSDKATQSQDLTAHWEFTAPGSMCIRVILRKHSGWRQTSEGKLKFMSRRTYLAMSFVWWELHQDRTSIESACRILPGQQQQNSIIQLEDDGARVRYLA